MNMLSMALVAASTALLAPAVGFVSTDAPAPVNPLQNVRSIDCIVGDGDFNQVRPEYPADHATELRNHTERLQYIETMLRSRDVSDMPAGLRAARMRNLDRLRDYWMRGEYPVNYDHPNAWEPCFIDRKGAICAVGYLIEQSEGRAVAEKINSRYQYATIKEIDAPEVEKWIAQSGLTREEVVTIQAPAIGGDGSVRGWPIADRTPIQRVALEDLKNVQVNRGTAAEESSLTENFKASFDNQAAIDEPVEILQAPTPAPAPTPVAAQPTSVEKPGIE